MPAPNPDPANPLPAERQAANSLPAASLLALAGGSLDAFLYLQHGRVFAGAMTGNAVLCGIAILDHHHMEAVRHALPLLAFVAGIWIAEALADQLGPHAVSIGLGGEALGLALASFLPSTVSDLVFVPLIALLAAYQIASFRKADQYSYNSTFITGDLRTAVVGLYQAFQPSERAAGLHQARALGLIIFCFLAGAAAGALLSPRFANHTLWFPVATLLVVLWLVLRRLAKEAGEAKRDAGCPQLSR